MLDLSEQEFEISTPRFFVTKYNGKMRIKKDIEKSEWERARYIAQRANTPYMKRTPSGWWALPWDKKSEEWTKEQWNEFNRIADERFPKKWKN